MRRMFRTIKPGDYAIIVFSVLAVIMLFYRSFSADSSELYVDITGESFKASYDPWQERIVEVEGPLGVTRVVMKDGVVWVEDSTCRDKICIKMGKIKRSGEQIVCLPNRVVIELKGKKELFDAVTQ